MTEVSDTSTDIVDVIFRLIVKWAPLRENVPEEIDESIRELREAMPCDAFEWSEIRQGQRDAETRLSKVLSAIEPSLKEIDAAQAAEREDKARWEAAGIHHFEPQAGPARPVEYAATVEGLLAMIHDHYNDAAQALLYAKCRVLFWEHREKHSDPYPAMARVLLRFLPTEPVRDLHRKFAKQWFWDTTRARYNDLGEEPQALPDFESQAGPPLRDPSNRDRVNAAVAFVYDLCSVTLHDRLPQATIDLLLDSASTLARYVKESVPPPSAERSLKSGTINSNDPDVAQIAAALADARLAGGLSKGYYRVADAALERLATRKTRSDTPVVQVGPGEFLSYPEVCGDEVGGYSCQLPRVHSGPHVCPDEDLSKPVHTWARGFRCRKEREGDRCYLDAHHNGECVFEVPDADDEPMDPAGRNINNAPIRSPRPEARDDGRHDRLVARNVFLKDKLNEAKMRASQPPVPVWVVNSASQIGVYLAPVFFWLHKGRAHKYPEGKYEDGTPVLWRRFERQNFYLPDHYVSDGKWASIPSVLEEEEPASLQPSEVPSSVNDPTDQASREWPPKAPTGWKYVVIGSSAHLERVPGEEDTEAKQWWEDCPDLNLLLSFADRQPKRQHPRYQILVGHGYLKAGVTGAMSERGGVWFVELTHPKGERTLLYAQEKKVR